MGASLAAALTKTRKGFVVAGYARRAATRRQALSRGIVKRVYADPAEAVRGADIVVLCVPVMTIPSLLRACRPGLAAGTIVTDVGSTKDWLVKAMRRVVRGTGALVVGSHPIAGSDETGLEAMRVDLYKNAVVAVTGDAATDAVAAGKVARMWQSVGGRVVCLSPRDHDAVVARTSHLPHMVAAALVRAVLGQAGPGLRSAGRGFPAGSLCGAGFSDSTRIAGGSELLWHDIVRTNRGPVLEALRVFESEIAGLRRLIAASEFGRVKQVLAASRQARRAWEANRK